MPEKAGIGDVRSSYYDSTPAWKDDFNSPDLSRRLVESHVSWDNNYSSMEVCNQRTYGGYLNLRFNPYDPENASSGRTSAGVEMKTYSS